MFSREEYLLGRDDLFLPTKMIGLIKQIPSACNKN